MRWLAIFGQTVKESERGLRRVQFSFRLTRRVTAPENCTQILRFSPKFQLQVLHYFVRPSTCAIFGPFNSSGYFTGKRTARPRLLSKYPASGAYFANPHLLHPEVAVTGTSQMAYNYLQVQGSDSFSRATANLSNVVPITHPRTSFHNDAGISDDK
ncbi:Hypothetical predicted protein [Olea europaea subsp. europaea]|uniref:Uncharacterized protein n=1 Tax=Olea europaea subsp. europaea TaxID=158383 RepID=A0A8S0U2A4_OLEEU|nr:Hypothetical predicted protein [Olea europaea subsp. europaea]